MAAHDDGDVVEALGSFLDEGWISEVLFEVKSGKEATVYCCRAPGSSGEAFLAAKVYRAFESRRFKNDAIYQTGRMHLARNGRVKRAAENKSAFGRKVQAATWIDNEWETMNLLFDAGLDVPRPLARSERAILMPYLGDETGPAPKLGEIECDRDHAGRIADRLLWNIEQMLDLDRVHGDLSPFNVLFWAQKAWIIDFPQAIDPRLNPAAHGIFGRDVENICRWAIKHGAPAAGRRDAAQLTRSLWSRFVLGEIG